MYEELVKSLRCCAAYNDDLCNDCKYHNMYVDLCYDEIKSDAADVIEKLDAINQRQMMEIAVLSKLKWISVTERLPEIRKKVLVLAYGNDVFTAMLTNRAENNNPVFECDKSFLEIAKPGRITHWMPLPEPPKEET